MTGAVRTPAAPYRGPVTDDLGAAPTDLAGYPFHHEVRSRWGDMDALGHLNNVAIARYYEDARVTFHEAAVGTGLRIVLAEITIRYLAETHHPGRYTVGMGVARVGTSSVTHLAGLFLDGARVGACRSVIVRTGPDGPAPLPDEARAGLARYAFAG